MKRYCKPMIERSLILRLNSTTYPPTPDELGLYAGSEFHAEQMEEVGSDVRLLAEARAVVVIAAKLRREAICRLANCRVIARFGTGVDNIDVEAATERGIIVTNYPDFCISDMAEHTMALLLGMARKLLLMDSSMRTGAWDARVRIPVHRVSGLRLGLIGYGRIAQAVAVRAAAFGLNIAFSDPCVAVDVSPVPATAVGLDELLETSDFISVHVPLTEGTRHMIGAAQFRKMKPSAVLINTARGAIVDERALVRALSEGWIAGAGLDVYEELAVFSTPEAVPQHPLLTMRNVILTPHSGGCSVESLEDLMREGARQLVGCLRGEKLRNVVNREVLSRLGFGTNILRV